MDFFFESHFDQSVSFIEYEDLNIFEGESFGVLEVVKQATSCGNDKIRRVLKVTALLVDAGATKDCYRSKARQILGQRLEH